MSEEWYQCPHCGATFARNAQLEDHLEITEGCPEGSLEPDAEGWMRARPPGDMHEPQSYSGELDWPEVGQFTD